MSRAGSIRSADAETVETELMLADLESLERRIDRARQEARAAATRRRRRCCRCVERVRAALAEGKPARSVDAGGGRAHRCSVSCSSLTAKPILYVCNVDEACRRDRQRAVRARRRDGARRRAPARSSISAAIEAEVAQLADAAERAEFLASLGLEGNRARPRHPRRLRAARPDHLFHRRAEGGARLDHRQGHQGAAGRRRHPHRFRARLHRAPRSSPMPTTSPAAASRAPRTPARCVSKAATMSSPTAT